MEDPQRRLCAWGASEYSAVPAQYGVLEELVDAQEHQEADLSGGYDQK